MSNTDAQAAIGLGSFPTYQQSVYRLYMVQIGPIDGVTRQIQVKKHRQDAVTAVTVHGILNAWLPMDR